MSTSKATSKGKKPAKNLTRITTQRSQNPLPPYPNNPITPPGPRPLADLPLYSPHMYHTNSMPVQFFPQQQVDPQTFYLAQAQAQNQEDFEPFLNYQYRQQESSDETVPDIETQVPETQPEDESDSEPQEQPQMTQKQVTRRKCLQWSIEEEQLLARTWVNVSEDPIVGKDQKSDTFWRKVTTIFLKYMNQGPDYRTKDQLYTKWRNMNKNVMEFNAYHMNAIRDWPSGANNDNQLATILNKFRVENNKTFKYVHVWLVVKDSSKWRDIPTSDSHTSASKRSKMSTSTYSASSESRGDFDFDLNDNPYSPRPMGRDAAKRKARGVSSSSEGGDNIGAQVEKIGSKIGTFLDIATDQEYRREKRSALRFLATDESNYHGDDLQALLEEKEEIRKKYNIGGNRA